MDREDYQIFSYDTINCDAYITERDFTSYNVLSQSSMKQFQEISKDDSQKDDDMKFLKLFEIEDSAILEKMEKEKNEKAEKNAYVFAERSNELIQDYHERKMSFFNNFAGRNAETRRKQIVIQYLKNPLAEKYCLEEFSLNNCNGLDPAKWPEGLDDLHAKLFTIPFEEIFHQPFDIEGKFHSAALEFIRVLYEKYVEKPNSDDEVVLVKCMQVLLAIKIMEGDFTRIMQVLQDFNHCMMKNPEAFNRLFTLAMSPSSANSQNLIMNKITKLIEIFQENNCEVYPIMRSYSFIDYFEVSQTIHYFPDGYITKSPYAIATDSSYLFVNLSGKNGGLYKVGTGKGGTIQGKVYGYLSTTQDSAYIVYAKKKLYYKSACEQRQEGGGFGLVKMINPERMKEETTLRLNFDENAKHSSVIGYNEGFVLLGDEENLYALILEPELNEQKESPVGEKKIVGESPQVTHINLIMYTFPLVDIKKEETILSEENTKMLDELFESFAYMFTKKQCRSALEKEKWNFEQAANNLISNSCSIKDPVMKKIPTLEYSKKLRLFQTRVDEVKDREGYENYYMTPGCPFNSTMFDTLKWCVIKDKLIGYQLKEGECAIFGLDAIHEREFTYLYTEKPSQKGGRPDQLDLGRMKDYLRENNEMVPPLEDAILHLPREFHQEVLHDFLLRESSQVRDTFVAKMLKVWGVKEDSAKKGFLESISSFIADEKVSYIESHEKSVKSGKEKLKEILKIKEDPGKMIEDTVKGTLMKTLPAMKSSTGVRPRCAFCYDRTDNCFYIVSNCNDRIGIHISTSFEDNCKLLQDRVSQSINKTFEHVKHFFEGITSPIDYRIFYENIFALILYLHTKKEDMDWRYSNWNYFYSTLYFKDFQEGDERLCRGRERDNNILIPRPKAYKEEKLWNKVKMTAEMNETALKAQLPNDLTSSFTFVPLNSSELSGITPHGIPSLVPLNAPETKIKMSKDQKEDLFGTYSQHVPFQLQGHQDKCPNLKDILDKNIFIPNRRIFFHIIDGEEQSLRIILTEISESLICKNNIQLLRALILAYLWIDNANYISIAQINGEVPYTLLEGLSKLKAIIADLLSLEDTPENHLVRSWAFHILLSGWELLCRDLESQMEWFYKLYSQTQFNKVNLHHNLKMNILYIGDERRDIDPFYVLLQKIYMTAKLPTVNNFGTVHSVKTYCIQKYYNNALVAIPKLSSVNLANISYPFYWILSGLHLQLDTITETKQLVPQKFGLGKLCLKKMFAHLEISSHDSNNNEDYLTKISDTFWEFLLQELFHISEPIKKKVLLNMLYYFFVFCVGDLTNSYNQGKQEESSLNRTEEFLKRNFSLLKKMLQSLNDYDPDIVQRYSAGVMNSMYCHFRKKPVTCIFPIMDELKSLLDEIQNCLPFNSLLENAAACLSSTGGEIENMRELEFKVGEGRITINETITFPGATLIAVETELKQIGDGFISNNEMIIATEDHAANDPRLSYSNYYGSMGTCYRYEIVNEPMKRFFLPCESIKILSGTDEKRLRYGRDEPPELKKQAQPDWTKNTSILRIKCYPINNIKIALNGMHGCITDSYSLNWIDFVKDIDHFISLIITKCIQSLGPLPQERDLLEVLKEPILKLGFAKTSSKETMLQDLLKQTPFYFDDNRSQYTEKKDEQQDKERNIDHLLSLSYPTTINEHVNALLKEFGNLLTIDNYELTSESFGKLKKILSMIRENSNFKEPQNYVDVKRYPSFNKKIRALWNIVEYAFCLCMIYQLSLEKEFNEDHDYSEYFTMLLKVIGKRVNTLLNWMSRKLKRVKPTYDSTRNYLNDLTVTITNVKQTVKEMLIDTILREEASKTSQAALSLDGKNEELQLAQSEQMIPVNVLTKDELDAMNLDVLIKAYPKYFQECEAFEVVKNTINIAIEKIKNDLNEQYSGNPVALKDICEANGIGFNQSNLQHSLKQYSDHVLKNIFFFIPFDDVMSMLTNNVKQEDILKNSYSFSPFIKIPYSILERLSFLMRLNQIKTSEEITNYTLISRMPTVDLSKALSTTATKLKLKKDDEDKVLSLNEIILIRSICNFLSDENLVSDVEAVMKRQYLRYHFREMGLKALAKKNLEEVNKKQSVSKLFSHLFGIISGSMKEDLFDGLANVPEKFKSTEKEVQVIADFYISSLNAIINSILPAKSTPLSTLRQIILLLSDFNVLVKSFPDLQVNNDIVDDIILNSMKCIFKVECGSSDALIKMKSNWRACVWTLASRIMKTNKSIATHLFEFCLENLEVQFEKKEKVELIAGLLEYIYSLSSYLVDVEDNRIVKISERLFDLAVNSSSPILVNLLCTIGNALLKSSNLIHKVNMDLIYEKLGVFMLLPDKLPFKKNDDRYYIAIHMNSLEVDYQFLVNALYQWEERYPTQLSLYKNQEEFEKLYALGNSLDKIPEGLNIHKNIAIKVTPISEDFKRIQDENGLNIGKQFNRLASKAKKMDELDKVVNMKIEQLKKEIESAEKENDKARLLKLRTDSAHMHRIQYHIIMADKIGENTCSAGFTFLENPMPRSQAEEFAELVQKSEYRMLPKINSSLESNEALFADQILYPSIPDASSLLPGCTNFLKETTTSFIKVTLVADQTYQKIKAVQKKEQEKFMVTRSLSDHYKIFDEHFTSGGSKAMIMDILLNMIYSVYDSEKKVTDFIRIVQSTLAEYNLSEQNFKLIGLLFVLSGGYRKLRVNSKARILNVPESTCRIIRGGHKTGQATSSVLFTKDKSAKIEQVNNSQLEKIELNSHLLAKMPLMDLIVALNKTYEWYQTHSEDTYSGLLLHLLLKIIKQKRISQEDISNLIKSNETMINNFSTLKIIANENQWISQSLTFWEIEFMEAFERVYDKITINSDLIFSPVFISFGEKSTNYIMPNEGTEDLITGYVLPESTYLSKLPKITDQSKCSTAMKNVENLEKYLVEIIFNAYKGCDFKEDAILAILQVRSFLLTNNLNDAVQEIRNACGGLPPGYSKLFKEEHNMKEISKEQCYSGNCYLAKMTGKMIKDCGIQSLMKYEREGVIEVQVILLNNDNFTNKAMIFYIDHEYATLHAILIPTDKLMFLENQLKIPAISFSYETLINELHNVEKYLNIIYAKKALLHILNSAFTMPIYSVSNLDDLIFHTFLSNWEAFHMNPEEGVFKTFLHSLLVKKPDNEMTTIGKSVSKHIYIPKESDVLILAQQDDRGSNVITATEDESRIAFEDKLNELLFASDVSHDIVSKLNDWCIEMWEKIGSQFIQISVDLFQDYNIQSNEARSKEMFTIGIFSTKLLALHELAELKIGNYSGIIVTFQREAFVGPQAKVSFYTDPYGENLAYEMISIKVEKRNLEAIVFNQPKIWMKYTPGTAIFDIYDWASHPRDSYLPCCITFIPHNWPTIIYLTELLTNAPFTPVISDCSSVLPKFTKELFRHCASLSLPEEIQRKIFSMTNRILLKEAVYLSMNQHDTMLQIEDKFSLIGIEPDQMIRLIENMSTVNSDQFRNNNFSSSYIVEGVEIVLALLLTIKETFTTLDDFLKKNYNYSLPKWIESIIKLGQFLTFLQGNSDLERKLITEIDDQLKITSQFEKILIIGNVPIEAENQAIIAEIKSLLTVHHAKVVDLNKDVQIFANEENSKTVAILTDGFAIDKQIALEGSIMNLIKSISLSEVLRNKSTEVNLTVIQGEDLNKALEDTKIYNLVNSFLKLRLEAYLKDKSEFESKINELDRLHVNEILKVECELLRKMVYDASLTSLDLIQFYRTLQTQGVDFWLDAGFIDSQYRQRQIDISTMEKIREIVDLKICKEQNITLIFPSLTLRFVPIGYNSINHTTTNLLNNYGLDIPLADFRYYWTIIKYFNNCLVEALPFIRPPEITSKEKFSIDRKDYISIGLPKTISAFLAHARGITFSHVKNNLLKEILSHSEFEEESIQIPTFKFERINILENQEKSPQEKALNPENGMFFEEEEEQTATKAKEEKKIDESIFLQAYQQAKDVDPAFFRSMKIGNDHTGFKVEFKGELVQGISGPYRQFFSDILIELQDCNDMKKKSLRLLHPSSNKVANRGEFKDKYTISPSYNTPLALSHYEFFGMLMGICIRTGVYMPLDLCSLVWKQIINEPITMEDIKEFDEGLFEQIKIISYDKQQFEEIFSQTFSILLTDGTPVELIPDGTNTVVDYDNRYKFMQLALKARIFEAAPQIDKIRKGLSKMIPISLLQLLTYREMERLVCGIKTIDVDLLKENTHYSDNLKNDVNRVQWLWEILNEFSEEERIKFVKFCWAQERLPPTQDEYNKKQVKFTVKSMDNKKKDLLPKADTCFFFLILPEYSSKEVMKKMISLAINLDNIGLNGDFQKEERAGRMIPQREDDEDSNNSR